MTEGGQDSLAVTWASREPPLEPTAVLGLGSVALELAARVLGAESKRTFGPWRGVASPASDSGDRCGAGDSTLPMLALLGDDLPWVAGVSYFGASSEAPALLLPTHLEPSVPVGLLQRIVGRRRLVAPLFVVPEKVAGAPGDLLISAAAARIVDAAQLSAWVRAWDPPPEPPS